MGVKKLNKFIDLRCKKAVKLVSLKKYENKKIVIDINNYLYRYKGQDTLIDNVFQMCVIFNKYNIKPIYVFDNRTRLRNKDDLKYKELRKRVEEKDAGEKQYKVLQDKLETMKTSEDKDSDKERKIMKAIEEKLKVLKRNIVRLKSDEIAEIKELIAAFNMVYYDAPNEADEVCAYLSINGYVDACMSEDSDMFIYGCPVILKHISMVYETVKEYTYDVIIDTLGISCENFRRLCIISGTDYNIDSKYGKFNIFYYYKKHMTYVKNDRDYLVYKFKLDSELDDYDDRVVLNTIFENYTTIDNSDFTDALDIDFNEEAYDVSMVKEVLKKHHYYYV